MKQTLIDPDIPVFVQGATGRAGRRHLVQMREYGSNIVAGVSPNARETDIESIPIYTNCQSAVHETGAITTVIMVPPFKVLSAIKEAVEAGCKFLITVTEGVPVKDCIEALDIVNNSGATWIGPSTPGIAIPNRLKLGFLPDIALRPGHFGIVSKSGTLSYEIGYRMAQKNLGQSLWIGVGGDFIKGTRFAQTIPIFEKNADTHAIILVGEVGGSEEEEFAKVYSQGACTKPVFAIVSGKSTREGLTMGHAGALIHGNVGTIESKTLALQKAGVSVFTKINELLNALDESVI